MRHGEFFIGLFKTKQSISLESYASMQYLKRIEEVINNFLPYAEVSAERKFNIRQAAMDGLLSIKNSSQSFFHRHHIELDQNSIWNDNVQRVYTFYSWKFFSLWFTAIHFCCSISIHMEAACFILWFPPTKNHSPKQIDLDASLILLMFPLMSDAEHASHDLRMKQASAACYK